jgi:MarR family transcriptional regulator, temperature-dependent positive regulator of motility
MSTHRRPADPIRADKPAPPATAAAPGKPAVPRAIVPAAYRRHIGHLSRRFDQVCEGIITEAAAPDGLTRLQFAVLVGIADLPGIDQRRLADAIGIVPVNAGQMLRELEEMGLVDRRLNGADRRARELRLTAKGARVVGRVLPRNHAACDRIVAPLTAKERETLMDLLIRVIESNDAYARPGLGRRKRGSRLASGKGK